MFLLESLEPRRLYTAVYTIHDLGIDVSPSDINDRGQIVGSRTVEAGNDLRRAFLYEAGTGFIGLGAGDEIRGSSVARAINNRGGIVGCADRHAASFTGGKVEWLLERQPEGRGSCAIDVNASGQILVVNRDEDEDEGYLGVIDGSDYSGLGRGTSGHLLDDGAVLGSLYRSTGKQPIPILEHDLMSEGGRFIDQSYEFIWIGEGGGGAISQYRVLDKGDRVELRFADLNDHGIAVGTLNRVIRTGFAVYDEADPFVFHGGNVLNLNTLIPADAGWELERAAAINEKGQIVGSGWFGGERHGFLLTPIAGAQLPTELSSTDVRLRLISKTAGDDEDAPVGRRGKEDDHRQRIVADSSEHPTQDSRAIPPASAASVGADYVPIVSHSTASRHPQLKRIEVAALSDDQRGVLQQTRDLLA